MKSVIFASVLLSATISADALADAPAKAPASGKVAPTAAQPGGRKKVTPDALASVHWIRGEAPKKWEPGVLYMIECSPADWSHNLSHGNELHKKYAGKGLRFISVNFLGYTETDEAIVKEVGASAKDNPLNYPVASTPRGTAFFWQWWVPNTVIVSPLVFLVKDGEILLCAHSSSDIDATIGDYLSGGEKQAAAEKKIVDINRRYAASLTNLETANNGSNKARPGVVMPVESLSSLNWLSGEAPAQWEPGVLYLIDFWCNWYPPTGTASIPRAKALHKKYADKGLRVIGLCQFGELTPGNLTVDKLREFVKSYVPKFTYPVVQSPENSDFDRLIKRARLLRRSDHMLFVKDGEILISAHPEIVSDELVEILLAGGETQDAALKNIAEDSHTQTEIRHLDQEFWRRLRAGDLDAVEKYFARLKIIAPNDVHTQMCRLMLSIARKDWEQVGPLFEKSWGDHWTFAGILPEDPRIIDARRQAAGAIAIAKDAPDALLVRTLDAFALFAENSGDPNDVKNLMLLRLRLGDREGALSAARLAVLRSGEGRYAKLGFKRDCYEKVATALERGNILDFSTVETLCQENLPWSNTHLFTDDIELALKQKDWAKVGSLFKATCTSPLANEKKSNWDRITWKIISSKEAPVSLLRVVNDAFSPFAEKYGDPNDVYVLMLLRVRLGDREAALAAARLTVERCRVVRYTQFGYHAAVYEPIVGALERGEISDIEDVHELLRTGKIKRAVAKPVPAKK